MAAVAIATPLIRATDTWQDPHDPTLTNLRLSLLDRRQSSGGVVRRQQTGSSRHSWRWSWKQMLTKPFQNQTWTRGGSLREKVSKKKRKTQNDSKTKSSVDARRKLDELYRIWLCEADESSESSDDEYSERDWRRSCIPRIFASGSSSSDTDTDQAEEEQVSQYVKDGPSRIIVDSIPEDDGTSLDLAGISRVQTQSQKPITKSEHNKGIAIVEPMKSDTKAEVVEIKRNTTNFEIQETVAKTNRIQEIKQTNSELLSATISQTVAKTEYNKPIRIVGPEKSDTKTEMAKTDCSKDIAVKQTQQSTKIRKLQDSDTADVSHDFCIQIEEGHEADDPRAMTCSPGMINTSRNESVISVTQIFHGEILKRVEELCAQCNNGFHDRNKTELETSGRKTSLESTIVYDNSKIQERGEVSFNKNASPQDSSLKESMEKTTRHVVPDYPSSYHKTGAQQQMTSQNEEHNSRLQCEFKRFGCQFLGTNMVSQLDQHMQSSLNEHLKLVCKTARDQKEQLQNQQQEQQKQSLLIQKLTDTVNNLEKLVKEQRETSQSQENSIHGLKDQIKDQRKQNQRFERDIRNQISQSQIRSLPTVPCAAEFVWPIKSVKRRLRRIQDGEMDDPLMSEPFYTGTYGYKLSMWVYLNGRGKSVGDWVSVYARVMPSEHDKILCWPVKPTYTFTLLDQSDGEKEHIVRKRKVNDIKRDGEKHHGIHRPESGERSVIVGFDDFITHAQLEKRYVVDDCIYLKVEANILY